MKIAFLSDSHDNIWKLEEALIYLKAADSVIHCGDLCSPFMLRILAEGIEGTPAHIVFGNNDGDTFLISKVAAGYSNIHLHGQMAELELDGVHIAVNHYPRIGRALALSRQYDLVAYGHDHTAHEEQVGDCLLLNPGELMGMKGRSSLALFDTANRKIDWVDL